MDPQRSYKGCYVLPPVPKVGGHGWLVVAPGPRRSYGRWEEAQGHYPPTWSTCCRQFCRKRAEKRESAQDTIRMLALRPSILVGQVGVLLLLLPAWVRDCGTAKGLHFCCYDYGLYIARWPSL